MFAEASPVSWLIKEETLYYRTPELVALLINGASELVSQLFFKRIFDFIPIPELHVSQSKRSYAKPILPLLGLGFPLSALYEGPIQLPKKPEVRHFGHPKALASNLFSRRCFQSAYERCTRIEEYVRAGQGWTV